MVRIHPHPPNLAGLAQLAERRPPKPKVRGSTPWSGARDLDVAKRPKASGCKPDGASPHPFESDRRVQASLAQWTRAAGFYPAGRPFESVTRHQFNSPIAQMAERLAVNQEVRGSKPRRGASSVRSRVAQWQSSVLIRRRSMDRSHPRVPILQLGVAQMAARVIWDHEAAGSRPATETTFTPFFNHPKRP